MLVQWISQVFGVEKRGRQLPNSTKVVSPTELGQRISAQTKFIIEELVAELRREIPILQNDSRTYLIDHLPQVLEHIGEFLKSKGSRLEFLESAKLGRKHGEQRAYHSNYSVSDIRKEYRLLRARLLTRISDDESVSKEAFDLLGQVIDTSLSHATEEFVRNSFHEIKNQGTLRRGFEQEQSNLRRLFAESPQFFAIMGGADFRFEYVNQAYKDLFGGKDFTGLTVAEAQPEVRSDPNYQRLQRVFQTGVSEIVRNASVPVGSELRHFDFIYSPRYDASGEVNGILVLGTDLTEQFKNAHAAENSRKELHDFFMQAPAPMCVMMGEDHVFTIANPLYREFIGRDPLGRPVREVFSDEEAGPFFGILDEVYKTGIPHVGKEVLFRKNGEKGLENFVLDILYHPFRDEDGIVRGIFAFVQDVSNQVSGREAAESQQKWLEEVLNRLPKPLFFFDPKTKKSTFSNAAADHLLGVSYEGRRPTDLYGTKIVSYFPDGTVMNPEQIPSSRAIRGENLQGDEFVLDTPTGHYHLRAFSQHMPALFGHDEMSLLLIQDITQLKAAESDAKNANAAKSQFLANMSHEIRTPLGAIMGFVSLLKEESLNRKDYQNFLSVIDRNSTQLLRIIDDILDLSKVEAGMMLIEHIDFSLPELMTDFSSLLGFKAREKGIGFFSRAVTPLPKIVNSDPTRLRQILMNIVGNAVKFTERGSVDLQVGYVDGFLEFAVTDTGRGITPDQEKNLFQPFSQGDTSTTRKYGGTGLGLVLTRSLSEALGGTFELQKSVLGKGSTFVARIKVDVAPKAEFVTGLGFASEPVRTAANEGQLNGMRLLLVEDSPDNQALISIFLGRAGALVDIASDGEQGYRKAKEVGYDAVLMDVQMPIMDGIQTIKKLRAEGYSRPVVALTAHAMKEERMRCLAAGFTDFLSKPVAREELISLLIRYKKPSR